MNDLMMGDVAQQAGCVLQPCATMRGRDWERAPRVVSRTTGFPSTWGSGYWRVNMHAEPPLLIVQSMRDANIQWFS